MAHQYSEFRECIARLGLTQSSLARRMKELGDDRDEKNILQSIRRMIAGDARFSGEMRAMLGMMELYGTAPPVLMTATSAAPSEQAMVEIPLADLERLQEVVEQIVARAV